MVEEVCAAILSEMREECIPTPTCDMWQSIASNFESIANFPHCLGAVDGKHIRLTCPFDSGSICDIKTSASTPSIICKQPTKTERGRNNTGDSSRTTENRLAIQVYVHDCVLPAQRVTVLLQFQSMLEEVKLSSAFIVLITGGIAIGTCHRSCTSYRLKMESRGWHLVKKAITELAEGSKKRDAEEDIKLETKKSKVDEPTSTESSCPNIVDITCTLEVVNKGQSCVNRKDDHLSKNENMDTNANSSPGCSFWTSECVKNTDIMYKKGSLDKNSDKTIENLDSSLWESVKISDDPSDMKVRLCKIKNNTEKIDTLKEYSDGDEVIDDTDADSDFVYSSSSSEDESFTERYQRNKKKTVALRRKK
ncbi:hypothetical protein J6590_088330 [Homalodisca vitripennis]|nr:hypothetical protein J6590_088330 [Homalodisca vitripennis]